MGIAERGECGTVVCWGRWRTINGKPVCIEDGLAMPAVVVSILLTLTVVGSTAAAMIGSTAAVGGAPAAGGATVDVAVGRTIQARTTSSRNAARRGQYEEAWRRLGLRAVRSAVRSAARNNATPGQECTANSTGQVRECLQSTPCRSMQRSLLTISDTRGNTIVVSIAWVRMPSAGSAGRLVRLADTNGTGGVTPIAGRTLGLRGVRFTGKHYASRVFGDLVVTAEATPGSGQPAPELLDSVARVASEFPEPSSP